MTRNRCVFFPLKDKKRLRFRVIHLIEFIQSNNFHIYSIFGAILKQLIHTGDLRAYCLESKYSSLCSVHFEEKCLEVDMYHQLMG